MSAIANQLPTDIEALQALLAAAQAERDAAIAERDQALSQMDRLRNLLRQLQRAQFGRRSEKLDPEQLLLAIEDIEQAIAGTAAADDKKDPAGARARADKRRASRGSLPGHLPHIDVTIAPFSDLAIDVFVPGDTGSTALTMHSGALQTSYVSEAGNQTGKT